MTTVTPVVGPTSQVRLVPYLSRDMFKFHARRGVQIDNLVPNGRPDQQDAALAQYIESASSWMDDQALQILAATVDTEQHRVNVDRRGYANIHPRYRPVIAVTAFQIGPTPDTMQSFASLSAIGVERGSFSAPVGTSGLLTSSQGPIQFGGVAAPMDQAWTRYTYVNGYPVTTLTSDVALAATLLPIADTTGIVEGQTFLTVYALEKRFRFLAGAVSNSIGGVGLGGAGTVVCPATPFAIDNDPTYPTMASGLPASLVECAVLVTRAIIKERGAGNPSATTPTSSRAARPTRQTSGASDDFAEAFEILRRHMNPVE